MHGYYDILDALFNIQEVGFYSKVKYSMKLNILNTFSSSPWKRFFLIILVCARNAFQRLPMYDLKIYLNILNMLIF